MKFLIVTTSILLILSSCISAKKLAELKKNPDGFVEVSDFKDINGLDQTFTLQIEAAPEIENNPGVNLGLHSNYQLIKYGNLDLSFLRKINFDNTFFLPESSVSQYQYHVDYDLPIINKTREKETAIYLYDKSKDRKYYMSEEGQSHYYYSILNTKYQRIWALKTGYAYNLVNFSSNKYAQSLTGENRFSDNQNLGTAYFNQGSSIAKLGISFSDIYLTSLNANDEKINFEGALYLKYSFYGGITYLINTASKDQLFAYKNYDISSQTFIDKKDYINSVDLFKKNKVGFFVGSEFTFWFYPVFNISMSMFSEFGFTPGYYENLKQGVFANFGLRYGLGLIKKK